MDKKQTLKILNSNQLKEFINNYKTTTKKWIRLRKTIEKKENKEIKEKTTLTIKHILKDNESNIQQMQETEIEVSSFEETNELLEKKEAELLVSSSQTERLQKRKAEENNAPV